MGSHSSSFWGPGPPGAASTATWVFSTSSRPGPAASLSSLVATEIRREILDEMRLRGRFARVDSVQNDGTESLRDRVAHLKPDSLKRFDSVAQGIVRNRDEQTAPPKRKFKKGALKPGIRRNTTNHRPLFEEEPVVEEPVSVSIDPNAVPKKRLVRQRTRTPDSVLDTFIKTSLKNALGITEVPKE